MPRRETSIGPLAAGIVRLKPFPAQLDGVARRQITALAPYMPFSRRVALANLWLFSPLVARAFADRPAMNAGMRTTLAPTIIAAGDKDNVLPASARAVVNARILPGETMQSVLAQVTK